MTQSHQRALRQLANELGGEDPAVLAKRLAPHHHPSPPSVPGGARNDPEARLKRWEKCGLPEESRRILHDEVDPVEMSALGATVENAIGAVRVPLGLAGPLRINGLHAKGDFYVPLATSEAALVASYHRGARVITAEGGCTTMLLAEGVSRCPGFIFHDLIEVGQFIAWLLPRRQEWQDVAEATTRHGKVQDFRITVEGNHVYLHLDMHTGDAAGQNMVTLAAEAMVRRIVAEAPIKPQAWYVEANLSGDKKASAASFQGVRGKKVVAEIRLSPAKLQKYLGTTAAEMERYWRISALGSVQSGSIGVQGHYANGLAAFFLACGQDVACVAEASVGITRMEAEEGGTLYTSVTLPNLIVGTVGGGTNLPTAAACLDVMGLRGTGKARALAEVCAGLALAGELSIIAALTNGTFARAHRKLARERIKD